jgi:hypothetical protein
MGLAAAWMEPPRSTVRAAHLALFGCVFYLGVSYMHFWSRPVGSSAWPSLALAGLAVVSGLVGVGLIRIRPNSWSLAHTFFVILGLGNLSLTPLMFELPIVFVPIGGLLCIVILKRLQTEDAFALAEPEAQAQQPKPVVFRERIPHSSGR